MRLRLADTKLDSNIEKPRSRFFVAPKNPSQIKEYQQPQQRFSLKLDSLKKDQQNQQTRQQQIKQQQIIQQQQIDNPFNIGTVIMPSERASEVNEQKFGVNSLIQQDDQNDIYEIDEYKADENNISQTMERASIHSVKSEQSFIKQRFSQQLNQRLQNENKGTNLINQNFYRLSPFDKPMMGQVCHLVLTKVSQQQLNGQQQLNQQPIKQSEQFNEVEVQEEVNKSILNYLTNEEVDDIQQTTRNEIPFEYPPILMNYLKSVLVYENEIIELTTIQQSDVQMQEQLTQCQDKFKQVMQNRLGRIKIKLIEAQRVAEYVDLQWPFFIQTNTECLDRYQSNINRITNFSKSSTIEELSERKYQPIIDDSQEYLLYLQNNLKYIDQSIAICQSMLQGNPDSIDYKITEDLGDLNRILDDKFINILDMKLERFFLNPQFPLLQQIYSSLDTITTRLVSQVSNFATYLEGVHQNLCKLLSTFLRLLCSFNSECCEVNKLLNTSYRCTKIDLLLEIGMESIAAVNIPISNEGSQAYNQELLKNSRAMEANAEGKLNKYIQIVLRGYPEKEFGSDLFDQEKRIKLLKHVKKKIKDLDLIEMVQQYPLLIIQRVEYFQIVLNIQKEYRQKIDLYKMRIEIFNEMALIEKQVYDLQLQREVIKEQFLKTENSYIVETMLEQLERLLSGLLDLQQRLRIVNWQSDMPIQILRLQQWISVEIGMTNKLQEILQIHLIAYQSQFTYEQDCSKFDQLYKSLSRIIKYEPTVNEILYGTSDVFLKQVLQSVLQSSTASTDSNLFDLSRTNPQLPFDIELLEHLDYLAIMQNNKQLGNMRLQYKHLYDNLSEIYNQYTIWQNVQSCRCLMDGEVLSEIIRSTLLFDEPIDHYQTLAITIGVLKSLKRGFILNIKNNENCVFFKIFVEQGIQCLSLIQSHFEQLKGYLKLNFNAKKTVRIVDLNRDLQVKVMGRFRNEDDPINIIKHPILDGLTSYIERNTFLFQTKGATLDWDKKLQQTKITLDEMDRILQDAFVYLQKIIESSLLDHFQPKQRQDDDNSITYLSFGPEEFYLQSEPLYQVQQSKLKAQKERLELENILNNQVKDPEYILLMKYFITVIDEMLLWFKSIEKVSRLSYLLMGKIKQILIVEDHISEDYLRNIGLFCKQIQQLINEIKSIERISPFNLMNINKEKSAWNCPEHYRVTITASSNIDNQQLLVLKISTICVLLTQQLLSNAKNLLLFQQFINSAIKIEDKFIDDLNKLIVFFGMRKVQNKKDTEALYDKTQEDLIFRKQLIEIPSYCTFPGKYLLMCFNSFDILAKDFQLQMNLPGLCDLNSILQEYLDGQETPIISLQVLVEEHLGILNFDVKSNKVKSKSNLKMYMTICQQCVIKIQKYIEMIKLVLAISHTNAIVKQKSLNRVDQDANLTQFIESEQNDWLIFMSLVYQYVKQYLDDPNQIEDFQQYWKHFDYELKKQTKKQDELGPQRNQNVKLLIQLYDAFGKVLENDFLMN